MNPLSAFQQELRKKKIDSFLVANPENRRYLSGYTAHQTSISESTGFLLIVATGPCFLLTDSRFQLQALHDCPDFELVIYKKGLLPSLRKIVTALPLRNLAFESDYFLHSQALTLQKAFASESFSVLPTENFVHQFRLQKSQADLEKIKKSVALNETVFNTIYPQLAPGLSEISVALRIEAMMRELGAERPSFETIVASGPNGALPHATPGSRRIQANEPIVIDMGLVLDGLCSDMTRTIVLGTPDTFTKKIFSLVRQAQLQAVRKLAPGAICADVDRAARSIIKNGGYGHAFGHGLGHGVGYAVHEAPSLNPRCKKKLLPGMVVTIEPGIYLPEWGGVRLENMYAITSEGSELLNNDTTFLDLI